MKPKTILFIVIGLIAVGIGLSFLLKREDESPVMDAGDLGYDPSPANAVDSYCSQELRSGSRGKAVEILQQYLNQNLLYVVTPLKVDGIFGPLTKTALKAVHGVTQTDLQSLNLC